MAGILPFGDLTKVQDNLLKDNYVYNHFLTATLVSKADEIEWKAKGNQDFSNETNSASILAAGALKYHFKGGNIRVKKNNSSLTKLNFKYTPEQVLPGVEINADLVADQKGDSNEYKGKIKYNHEQFKGQLTFTSDPLIGASLTFGNPKYGLGLDGQFCAATKRLIAYNAALFFNFDDQKLVFKHLSNDKTAMKLGDLVASYHRVISDKTQVGGKITTNCVTKNTVLEFGGAYKPIEEQEVRAKFDSDGKLGLSFRHELAKGIRLTIASLLDVKKVTASSITECSFGARIDFDG